MTTEEIEFTIDTICDKLGMGFDSVAQLVPKIEMSKIIINGFWAVLALAATVFFAILAIKFIKKYLADVDDFDAETYMIVGYIFGIAAICFAIPTAICASNIIGWATCPQVKAIEYICNMV